VIWDVDAATATGDSSGQVQTLSDQLEAMKERLQSMFATAADLIGAGGIGEVLTRITDRAAVEVRAPRHLLAARTSPGGELHLHHRGFPEDEVEAYAARILKEDPADLPESWLVVPVRSNRNDYGASVGRAAFPTDAKDAEGLLRAADAAMFETKRRHHELAPELVRSR
jgi:predicted signal transduction protein with EAL and GGDEF domain